MGSQASRKEEEAQSPAKEDLPTASNEDDDEPDEWDKRIFSTGCSEENAKMTDCYFETKDWRACTEEMEKFRECWKQNGNESRTGSRDA